MLAEEYFKAASFCLEGERIKKLELRSSTPTFFLFSHAIELSLKSWMMQKGKSELEIRNYSHNLNKLLRDSFRQGLEIKIEAIAKDFATKSQELHIDRNGEIITELQRLKQIPQRVLRREFLRHFQLLSNIHGKPYRLRYTQTGYYSMPNIELVQTICNLLIDQVWRIVMQSKRSSN